MSEPSRTEMSHAAALAAAFIKHDYENNTEGRQAVIDEVNRSGIHGTFVRALSAYAVNFGKRHYGEEKFAEELQGLALDFQSDIDTE